MTIVRFISAVAVFASFWGMRRVLLLSAMFARAASDRDLTFLPAQTSVFYTKRRAGSRCARSTKINQRLP